MILAAPVFEVLEGEEAGDRVARILRVYNGCSLLNTARLPEFAAFIGRGVCDESFVRVQTNCATTALALLSAAGVKHEKLARTTAIGAAFSDMVQIGLDFDAWEDPVAQMPTGAFAWYRLPGMNDDHVEIMLTPPDEHGGGGRSENAITIGHGDEHVSWTRPVHKWLNPTKLGIPVLNVAEAYTR